MYSELFVTLVELYPGDGGQCRCELHLAADAPPADRVGFDTGPAVAAKFGLANPGDTVKVAVWLSDFVPENPHGEDPTVRLVWTVGKPIESVPEPDPEVVIRPEDWRPAPPRPPADVTPPAAMLGILGAVLGGAP